MSVPPVRVRFAPSPTGLMHLGNVRAALLNYLFAKKHGGIFILRVEDTDPERNVDPQAQHIIADLTWLGLTYNEGPGTENAYGPYFQSQRTALYQQKLAELQKKDVVYRCFCTSEELERKRQQHIALKVPPRYDRTCLAYSAQDIATRLEQKVPFIWRLKTTQDRTVTITDLAHGTITYNLKDVADIPLTRADGSFTFIFANCVDDVLMKISHIIRGEDHLTNTASQVVLYETFEAPLPTFWHLPIICNNTGKKLSKRDFGFSLTDLRNAGYLPEAICNYLGIIGGSFEHEIMNLDELAQAFHFDNLHSTGHIRYDVEKLTWVNHKWIARLSTEQLLHRIMPLLVKEFPDASSVDSQALATLITLVRSDLNTLNDIVAATRFFFATPSLSWSAMAPIIGPQAPAIAQIIKKNLSLLNQPEQFIAQLKKDAQANTIALPALFAALRLMLTGHHEGLRIHDLFAILGSQAEHRIKEVIAQTPS